MQLNLRFLFFAVLFLSGVFVLQAQTPTLSVTLPDSVCPGAATTLTNNSTNVDTGCWDFCPYELEGTPTGTDLGNVFPVADNVFRQPEMVKENGQYIMFASAWSVPAIYRLNFGSNPNNTTPAVSDITAGPLSLYNNPGAISAFQEGNTKYLVIANWSSGKLILYNFGNSYLNTPTATDLSNFGAEIAQPLDIKAVADDNGSTYFIVSNFATNTLKIIKFPGGVSNPGTVTDLTPSLTQVDRTWFDLKKIGNDYVFLGIDLFDDQLFTVVFQDSLDGAFAETFLQDLTNPIVNYNGNNNLGDIELLEEAGDWYGLFLIDNTGDFVRIALGPNPATLSAPLAVENIGNLGIAARKRAMTSIKTCQDYSIFAFAVTSMDLFRLNFEGDCGALPDTSTQNEPTVTFNEQGTTQYIYYEACNTTSGICDTLFDSLAVKSFPEIGFENSPVCDTNAVLFSDTSGSTFPIPITSQSWDFGFAGPGNTASGPTALVSFPDTGSYTVSLALEAQNNCQDTFSTQVRAWPDPEAGFELLSSLCSGSPLTFADTSTVLLPTDSIITRTWIFNSTDTLTGDTVDFTFTSPGNQTVKLVVTSAQGCQDSTETTITLNPGPTPLVSFSDVCIGQPVNFTNNSTAPGGTVIDSVFWNFGDSNSSSLTSPTHTYAAPGEYIFTLYQETDNGCFTEFQDTVIVGDVPNAGFTVNNPLAGQQTLFTDTSSVNFGQLNSWTWDFGGLGGATTQNPSFSFASAGNYTIELTVQTSAGCSNTTNVPLQVYAINISVPDSLCSGDSLFTSNATQQADEHYWDFCPFDFQGNPVPDTLTYSASFPDQVVRSGASVEENCQFYHFVSDFSNEELIRLEFGTGIQNLSPTATAVPGLSAALSNPGPVATFEYGGDKMAAVVNLNVPPNQPNSSLVLLNFGNSYLNAPAINDLGNFGVSINNTISVEPYVRQDTLWLLISDFSNNHLQVFRFVGNTTAVENLDTLSSLSTFDQSYVELFEYNGSPYAFLLDWFDTELSLLDFSAGFTNGAVLETPLADLSNLTGGSIGDLEVVRELGNYYLFVQGTEDLIKVDLGTNPASGQPPLSITSEGNLGSPDAKRVLGVLPHLKTPRLLSFETGTGTDLNIYSVGYRDSCGIVPDTSSIATPAVAVGGLDSTNYFYYQASFPGCVQAGVLDSVYFRPFPVLGFQSSPLCASNSVIFQDTSGSGFPFPYTLQTWSFGSFATDSGATVQVTFPDTGAFSVTLNVETGNGCSGDYTQEVVVRPLPEPGFEILESLCANTNLTFVDTSAAPGDSIVQATWIFNGADTLSGDTISYSFPNNGPQTVKLIVTSGAGCQDSLETVITLDPGPTPIVNFSDVCIGDSVNFVNGSTYPPGTTLDSLLWSFGDGNTSTNTSTSLHHTYSDSGIFIFNLYQELDNGCFSLYQDTVVVGDPPSVDFSVSNPIVNQTTFFTDNSLVEFGNLSNWQWDFDVPGGSSTVQDPTFTYTSPGTYNVSLQVETSAGCVGADTQQVNVYAIEINVPDTICAGDSLVTQNFTQPIPQSFWDLCPFDLQGSPESDSLQQASGFPSSLPRPGATVVENGQVYYFLSDINNNQISRLDFGTNISNLNPAATTLPGIGPPELDQPGTVAGFEYLGQKMLAVANLGNNNLVLLNFGNSYLNSPSVNDLGNVNGNIENTLSLEPFVRQDTLWLLLSDFSNNHLQVIRFIGTTDTVESQEILSSLTTFDQSWIELFEYNNSPYAFLLNWSSHDLSLLDFGGSISSGSITESPLTNLSGFTGSIIGNMQLVEELGNYYLFVQGNTDLIKLDLGTDPTTGQAPLSIANEGNLGSTEPKRVLGLLPDPKTPRFLSFETTNGSNFTAFSVGYRDSCGIVPDTSQQYAPVIQDVQTQGLSAVYYQATFPDGTVGAVVDTFFVPFSPQVSFSVAGNCVASDIGLTNTTIPSTDSIISWQWDFGNGDASSVFEPPYTYNNAGAYSITLQATTEAGCVYTDTNAVNVNPSPNLNVSLIDNLLACDEEEVALLNNSTISPPAQLSYYTVTPIDSSNLVFYDAADDTLNYSPIELDSTLLQVSLFSDSACSATDTLLVLKNAVQLQANPVCLGEVAEVQATAGAGANPPTITAYNWLVNGSPFSTASTLSFTPNEAGTYLIELQYTLSDGCAASSFTTLVIESPPVILPDLPDVLCATDSFDLSLNLSNLPSAGYAGTLYGAFAGDSSFTNLEGSLGFRPGVAGPFHFGYTYQSENGCNLNSDTTIYIRQNQNIEISTYDSVLCVNNVLQPSLAFNPPPVGLTPSYRYISPGNNVLSFQDTNTVYVADTGQAQLVVQLASDSVCPVLDTLLYTVAPFSAYSVQRTNPVEPLLPGDALELCLYPDGNATPVSDSVIFYISQGGTLQDSLPAANGCVTAFAGASGTYLVEARFITDGGKCVTIESLNFQVADPEGILFDIELLDVENPLSEGQSRRLTLRNHSSVTIDSFALELDISGTSAVLQQYTIPLPANETIEVNTNLLAFSRRNIFECYHIRPLGLPQPEVDTTNNKLCFNQSDELELFSVHPNPVDEQLNLEIYAPEDFSTELRVYNSLGQIVRRYDLKGQAGFFSYPVSVDGLTGGMYFLRIEDLEEEDAIKFIKN